MDKNIAIQFDNVGKQYRLGLVGTGSLQHDINRWWQTSVLGKEDPYLKIGEVNDRSVKGHSDYVWALKDINFKVEQGDVVGIIGKNGAGKSTLLKLLSHITAPTTGHIAYRGRIASLLEVGTGFHGEMTARENIYMNGSIMGMTKREIDGKLDEIVDFSGIERYLDTPVKRFSSGMTVRLGFAVAAFLEPEILVVDEVLAVGDAEFQKKAIGKMKDVSTHGGRTVLFVSHNMNSLLNLCNNGVLLENGLVKCKSNIQSIVSMYLADENTNLHFVQEHSRHSVYLHEVHFAGTEKNTRGIFSFEENIKINVSIRKNNNCVFDKQTVASVCIVTILDTRVCTTEIPLTELEGKDTITYNIEYPASLLSPGKYYFRIDLHVPNVCLYDGQSLCHFTITDNGSEFIKYGDGNNGIVMVKPQIGIC